MSKTSPMMQQFIFVCTLLLLAFIAIAATLVSVPAATTAPATTLPPQGDELLFLPMLSRAPEISSIQFGYSLDCDSPAANFMEAPVTMPSGMRVLGLAIEVDGADGRIFKAEWVINGQLQEGLGSETMILGNSFSYSTALVFGVSGACEQVIPAGTYEVRGYIDDVLYKSGTATSVGGRTVSAETNATFSLTD